MENNQKQLILLEDLGMMYLTEASKQKKRIGLYKCSCNKEFKAQTAHVKNGTTKSCGCLKGKMITESKITHGKANTRIFKIWASMRGRCYNKNNPRYRDWGGKGIIVCSDWNESFTNFYNWAINNGYGDDLSIDRINNNANYSPENCRWTTNAIQARNTRLLKSTNTSGYRGVYTSRDKFKAMICVNKKAIYLGQFDTKIDAAKAYDNYVTINKLEHTKNFEVND